MCNKNKHNKQKPIPSSSKINNNVYKGQSGKEYSSIFGKMAEKIKGNNK